MATRTFLFTDIEGSTRRWEEHRDEMRELLEIHDRLISTSVGEHRGEVFKHTGDGAAAVFESATDAAQAAAAIQRRLSEAMPPDARPLRVRIGIHTGEADRRGDDWFGPALNRAARVTGAAHGGQILATASTVALTDRSVVTFRDLGEHRLRDLTRPLALSQVIGSGLVETFPELRTLDRVPHNLPVMSSSFIGRAAELGQLLELLDASRFVTITGVGGAGKTRLALQAAADFVGKLDGGVWLVELASLSEPSLVDGTVASALGVVPDRDQAPRDAIVDHLSGSAAMLILDNCEHVIAASADVVAELMRRLPDLHVLATSRELLGVPGEVAYGMRSMSLPEDGTDEGIMDSDAVALFVERATSARPRFELTADAAASVVELCRRLDGMPLAIELAAARIRAFTPQQIAAHLDDRFRLLTGGARTALPRQQTLMAAVDWSYRLLSESERALFRRLSVFAGGFDFTSVSAVCTSDDLGAMDVLELVPALVDKSLVQFDDAGPVARYRLLETLRQFARDRLDESGEGPDRRRRHAAHFAEMGKWRIDDVVGVADDPLELELENFRRAADWATQAGELGLAHWAYRTAGAILSGGGRFREQVPAYQAMADAMGPDTDPLDRAAILAGLGSQTCLSFGDASGIDLLIEAVDIYRGVIADPVPGALLDRVAIAINRLALLSLWYGRGGERNEYYVQLQHEMLALARRAGSEYMTALALANLAHHMHPDDGDPEDARRLFDEAARATAHLGSDRIAGLASQRGYFEFHHRRYRDAERYFTQSAETFGEIGLFARHEAAAMAAVCAVLAGDADRRSDVGREIADHFAATDAVSDPPTRRPVAAIRGIVDLALGMPSSVPVCDGIAGRLEADTNVVLRWDVVGEESRARARARDELGDADYDRLVAMGAAMSDEEALEFLVSGWSLES